MGSPQPLPRDREQQLVKPTFTGHPSRAIHAVQIPVGRADPRGTGRLQPRCALALSRSPRSLFQLHPAPGAPGRAALPRSPAPPRGAVPSPGPAGAGSSGCSPGGSADTEHILESGRS